MKEWPISLKVNEGVFHCKMLCGTADINYSFYVTRVATCRVDIIALMPPSLPCGPSSTHNKNRNRFENKDVYELTIADTKFQIESEKTCPCQKKKILK